MSSSRDKTSMTNWLKIAGTASTVFVTIIISMTGFWMMIGRDFITRDETRVIIQNEAAQLNVSLQSHSKILSKIDNTIEKNTTTITDLKVALTSLGALDSMEKRIAFLETEVQAVREEQIKWRDDVDSIEELHKEIRSLKTEIIHVQNSIERCLAK